MRGPVSVALAAGLLVAGRARRHAAAGFAAREARPGAPVLARVLAAPHVAGAAAVCAHAGERTRKQKVSRELGDAKNEKHRGRREARAYLWRGRRSGAAEARREGPAGSRRRREQPGQNTPRRAQSKTRQESKNACSS